MTRNDNDEDGKLYKPIVSHTFDVSGLTTNDNILY